MTRFTMALTMAVALSGAAALGQSRNLISEVNTVGCVRLWRPAPADPKQMPPDRQPGIAGIYLLTPLAANPTSASLPTYLLTPSATHNFWQHLDKKVEIIGTAQAAPMLPAVQDTATAPTLRPENKPSVQSMPRLTVTSLKLIADSCP